MTDDISMGALSGSLRERVAGALGAGCDVVLHCSGHIDEMRELAASVPVLAGAAAGRAAAALASRGSPGEFDVIKARRSLAALLAGAGASDLPAMIS